MMDASNIQLLCLTTVAFNASLIKPLWIHPITFMLLLHGDGSSSAEKHTRGKSSYENAWGHTWEVD